MTEMQYLLCFASPWFIYIPFTWSHAPWRQLQALHRNRMQDTAPSSGGKHDNLRQVIRALFQIQNPNSPPHSSSFSTYLCRMSFHCRWSKSLSETLVTINSSLLTPLLFQSQNLVRAWSKPLVPMPFSSQFSFQMVVEWSYISNAKAPPNTADKKTTFLRKRELHEY